MERTDRLRMAAALLLMLATIVLVIGITAERSVAGEPSPARSTESGGVTGSEQSEGASEEGVVGHDGGAAPEGADEAGSGEVMHQLSEARGSLAAIALVAAVLHIGVALIAGLGLTRGDSISTVT
jgi:hypothetical protein